MPEGHTTRRLARRHGPETWRHIGIGTARMRGVALLHTVRVYFGSDRAGFELKGFLVRHLSSLWHDVVDVRPDIFDVGDTYPPSCIETARRIRLIADFEAAGHAPSISAG